MCFEKLKRLFADPAKFFKDIAKEKSYWTVLKFFVIVYFTAVIVQTLASIPINLSLPEFKLLPFILMALLSGVIASFVSPFIGGSLAHLGVLLFGGRKGFFNTFKAVTYGMIVIVGYGVVSSIIAMIIFLLSPGSTFVSSSVIGIISLIGLIHMLFVQTIGVSMFHSISRIKAFFGIILVPLIILVLLVIIGVTFFTGLV